MALMSTCLARMGSRFNLILDPFGKEIHYGALGLLCQTVGEMIVEIDDGAGNVCRLPFSKRGRAFDIVDQHQTMTGCATRHRASRTV